MAGPPRPNRAPPPVYRPASVVSRMAAPPVYRPNLGRSAQRKAAPPVYRPTPLAGAGRPAAIQPKAGGLRLAAPPVYRPMPPGGPVRPASIQTKSSGLRLSAPPVYRPQAAHSLPTPPVAQRAAAAPAVQRKPQARVIQPKLGFELEIPVTFLKNNLENVDGKQTYLDGPYFKIVGDKSSKAGQMKGVVDEAEVLYNPTILELVTHPIDEHADDAQQKLQTLLVKVSGFRFRLDLLTSGFTKPITLKELAGTDMQIVLGGTENYIVNAPTATPRQGSPESAYLHVTVGVSMSALQRAGRWVNKRAEGGYPGKTTQTEAQTVMNEPELFGLILGAPTTPGVWEEIEQFIYLAYAHVRAIDRYENANTLVVGGGVSKNYTPFLSRSSFRQVFQALSGPSQTFIRDNKVKFKAFLVKHLHQDGEIVPKAQQYLNDIFDQSINTQSHYFGGMVERGIERTGKEGSGLQGPPVEIRPLGTELSEEQMEGAVKSVFEASRSQFAEKPSATVPDFLEKLFAT